MPCRAQSFLLLTQQQIRPQSFPTLPFRTQWLLSLPFRSLPVSLQFRAL